MRITETKLTDKSKSQLADILENLVKMYTAHSTREDTVVFVAWRESLSDEEFKAVEQTFKDAEQQAFKEDGFDYAIKIIEKIEKELGYSDISQFTM